MSKTLLLFAVLFVAGCTPEPPSAIIIQAEACGAGSVQNASLRALQDWFGKNKSCADAVDAMCKPVSASATASWINTSEGRTCLAARSVAQWIRTPSQDGQTFESGWK